MHSGEANLPIPPPGWDLGREGQGMEAEGQAENRQHLVYSYVMCSHHVTREKSPVIQPVIAFGRFGLWFGGLVDPWLRWVSKEGGLGGKGTGIRGYGSWTSFCALKRKMIRMRLRDCCLSCSR